MTDAEICGAFSKLYAWYGGCGPHDDVLEDRLKTYLKELIATDDKRFMLIVTRWLRNKFMSEEAIIEGFSFEDTKDFPDFLRDRLDIDL